MDSLLPTANKLLKPAVVGKLTERIKKWQQGAKYCCNTGTRELPELQGGQAERLPVAEKSSRGQGRVHKSYFEGRTKQEDSCNYCNCHFCETTEERRPWRDGGKMNPCMDVDLEQRVAMSMGLIYCKHSGADKELPENT